MCNFPLRVSSVECGARCELLGDGSDALGGRPGLPLDHLHPRDARQYPGLREGPQRHVLHSAQKVPQVSAF